MTGVLAALFVALLATPQPATSAKPAAPPPASSAKAPAAPSPPATSAKPAAPPHANSAKAPAAPSPPANSAKPAESPAAPEADLGHHGQVHLRAEFVTGYGMLFRYAKSPRCAPFNYDKSASDQQKFCGFPAPPTLGLALGFSLVDFFEPFVFARLGLANESDQTNQGKLVQLGAGLRLYTMSDSRFKIFFSPFAGIDLTQGPAEPRNARAQRGTPGKDDDQADIPTSAYRTDVVLHLDIGPQYDISKYLGIYASGGLTFQMLRYLGMTADLAVGLQMRAP